MTVCPVFIVLVKCTLFPKVCGHLGIIPIYGPSPNFFRNFKAHSCLGSLYAIALRIPLYWN